MSQASLRAKILVLAILLFLTSSIVAQLISQRTFEAAGLQSSTAIMSAQNKVLDYYVDGKGGIETIKGTPKSTVVTLAGKQITVTPWNTVKVQWTIGDVWIVFLANVTQNNFYIMFLYLTNSTRQFFLREFNYETGLFTDHIMDGLQIVYGREVMTPQVSMPALKIKAEPRNDNALSALGPAIYINRKSGRVLAENATYAVFPIFNQLFEGKDDYNELWTLMTDSKGGYFFAILYMANSNPNEVLLGHFIRLNDYRLQEWRSLKANWTKGEFSYSIVVDGAYPRSFIRIDGFPFLTDDTGTLKVLVPIGERTVEAASPVLINDATRARFLKWNDGIDTNPRKVTVKNDVFLKPLYKLQFFVRIFSLVPVPGVEGWYDEGSTLTASVNSLVDFGNATRLVFVSWSGDAKSTSVKIEVKVDGPKVMAANWKRQYAVAFRLNGLPEGTQVNVKINGQTRPIIVPNSVVEWIDGGSEVSLETEPTTLNIRGDVLVFRGWKNSGTRLASTFRVLGPATIVGEFSLERVQTTEISLALSSKKLILGNTVKISGSIRPAHADVQVTVEYSTDGQNWQTAGTAATDSDGNFVFEWKPAAKGRVFVRVSWEGDDDHKGAASGAESFENVEETALFRDPVERTRDFVSYLRSQDSPASKGALLFLAPAIAIYEVAVMVGGTIAVRPTLAAATTIGLFSALIGLVYLLPFLLLVTIIRGSRSRRRPSLKPILAVFALWFLSAVTLAAEPAFIVGSAFAAFLTLALLALASLVLFPMIISYAVGRAAF